MLKSKYRVSNFCRKYNNRNSIMLCFLVDWMNEILFTYINIIIIEFHICIICSYQAFPFGKIFCLHEGWQLVHISNHSFLYYNTGFFYSFLLGIYFMRGHWIQIFWQYLKDENNFWNENIHLLVSLYTIYIEQSTVPQKRDNLP